MASDSNAGALDAGLDTATAYVDAAPTELLAETILPQHADKLFAAAVDKALSARPTTAARGRALLLKLMEVSEAGPCCEYLLTRLADKKPKIPPACLDVVREAVLLFGVRAVPIKEVLKALPAVFNGSNSSAREAALALLLEVHRWIGQAPLQSLLDSLRTAQKAEFEKALASRPAEESAAPPTPSLYLRKDRAAAQQAAAAAAAAAAVEGTGSDGRGPAAAGASSIGGTASSGADAREFVDEVDLARKLKGTEFSSLLVHEKWSEQLRALQMVIDAVGPVPKLKGGTSSADIIGEILQACKGILRQGHVQLQMTSLRVLAVLADGLRAEFGSSVRPLLQAVVLKCKEKRLVPEVQAALHMLLQHCVAFDSCADDCVEAITSKSSPPHCKVGLIVVVENVLTSMPDKMGAGRAQGRGERAARCMRGLGCEGARGSCAGAQRASPDCAHPRLPTGR